MNLTRHHNGVDSISTEKVKPFTVCIVVPVFRELLSADEQLSLWCLKSLLGHYDCYQISPQSLKRRIAGFGHVAFEDHWFASVNSYSKLLLTARFYASFSSYEFLLIYQLDCLVFSDQLPFWCRQNFDYIGAPFPVSKIDSSQGFSRVGNGGLSLRRVEACLRVLQAPGVKLGQVMSRLRKPGLGMTDLSGSPCFTRLWKFVMVHTELKVGANAYSSQYTCNEDLFWSDRATLLDPRFRVAPLEFGFQFAFECWPKKCLDISGGVMPFGAHAWAKHGRDFWESQVKKL